MPLAPNDFVHLHVHSEYSLLDGANRVGPMVEHAKSMGMDALALTDHGVLFGALEFHRAARKAGIKPLIGCEVYITPNSRTDRGGGEQKATHHLLLLAENYEGYLNICRLSTIGHTEGFYYKPRIDFETLQAHLRGVVATSSCLAGLIPQALMNNRSHDAERLTGQFVEMFGRERFFMELMDHGLEEQRGVNRGIVDLARRHDLRLVATNDAHYMTKGDAEMHDCLLCIQTGARLADANRFRFDASEFYLKSTAEMAKLFAELPESITNTRLVAEMCNLQMPEKKYHIPRFPTPEGRTEAEHLRDEVWKGIKGRYGDLPSEEVRKRVEFELQVIEGMGFPSYFLIVADFIAHARSCGIPVGPGRGSAAGSIVAYALGITQLDPIENALLFERFLNPDRISMPDIDIDFCPEGRATVIEYVRQKYGPDCVAGIITFGTMKAKAAVRDVGRAMDIPLNVVDRVAKAIPGDLGITLPKAMEDSSVLRELVEGDPQIRKLVDMAQRVEGMVRHASTHAAGIIISDKPLTEYCPLYKSPNEEKPATQYSMNDCEEELGLLKMDFLGLKNLTVINKTVQMLKEREGVEIDFDKIRFMDPKTYESLGEGHTLGVFQLESDGLTALVKRLKPTSFSDLTALIALYRPGPLDQGMHHVFVDRKHGREKVKYDHPVLESILNETYGVILYQEQVMLISQIMCGFSGGEADTLRKAMGKKKQDVMDKMYPSFIEGAGRVSNVPQDVADRIWNNIVTFARYGFNKSHSAAYAVVTFQTAYLRANWPSYFLAALLTNEISGSTDGIAKYVADCREAGIRVMPVDINRSREYFNPDTDGIWYALNGVKGVGTHFAQAVVRERDADGPFRSLQDFCLRVPREETNSRMVEALIKVGAFDSLQPNRAALLGVLPEVMSLAAEYQRDRNSGQDDLFAVGDGDNTSPTAIIEEIPLPALPEWDLRIRAASEKEHLGFYLSDHPLKRYQAELEAFGTIRSSQLEPRAAALRENQREPVAFLAYISDVVVRTDKNGNPWGIVLMEDFEGPFECKFFSRAFEQCRELLQPDAVVHVQGQLSMWSGRVSLEGQSVKPADGLRADARGIEIAWQDADLTEEALWRLKEVCRQHGGTGSKPLRLAILHGEDIMASFTPGPPWRLPASSAALDATRELPGAPRVRLIAPESLLGAPRRQRFGS